MKNALFGTAIFLFPFYLSGLETEFYGSADLSENPRFLFVGIGDEFPENSAHDFKRSLFFFIWRDWKRDF